MIRPIFMVVAVLAVAASGSCTLTDPTGPVRPLAESGEMDMAAMRTMPSVPIIAGEYIFSERIWVLQPSELNPVIGAPAVDQPMTQVVCRALGTMSIDQAGATFDGTATQSVVCNVDGIDFVPPEFAFNPEFTVFNGRIIGHSIHFDTGHTLNLCPNRGSATVVNGVVESMRIQGSCPVLFHPGEHHSSWSIQRVPASP